MERRGDMNILSQSRNFRRLWTTTLVVACFSNAVAQSYKVADLGHLDSGNLGCAMGLNSRGWTEVMEGKLPPGKENFVGPLLSGRAAIDIDGINFDLGTLGGENSWTNYGGINEQGQAVGFAETGVKDPNGEDVCDFGTFLTCRPFFWQNGSMSALPTLGGNNGQASAINNSGQVAGFAENGNVDPTCPSSMANNRVDLGVLWENGKAQPLPPLGNDPDSEAVDINSQGDTVGYSGTCGGFANHAVLWEYGNPIPLPDLKFSGANEAYGINNQGQIVGTVSNGTFFSAALWQDQTLTVLKALPGDILALGEAINNQGQVVGSALDSKGEWSHALLWENGKTININTRFPASSNLYATMANQINEKGQISGMAVIRSGPHKGEIDAFLATPVDESIGRSVADEVGAHPDFAMPANAKTLLLHKTAGLGQLGR
jgi:probable HAF family extracellular repeat protein